MPDYKENIVEGEMRTWCRAENVVIRNPFGAAPTVTFNEESKISLPDGSVVPGPAVTDAPLTVVFDAADALHGVLYYKLNELYTLLREARDAAATIQKEEI